MHIHAHTRARAIHTIVRATYAVRHVYTHVNLILPSLLLDTIKHAHTCAERGLWSMMEYRKEEWGNWTRVVPGGDFEREGNISCSSHRRGVERRALCDLCDCYSGRIVLYPRPRRRRLLVANVTVNVYRNNRGETIEKLLRVLTPAFWLTECRRLDRSIALSNVRYSFRHGGSNTDHKQAAGRVQYRRRWCNTAAANRRPGHTG